MLKIVRKSNISIWGASYKRVDKDFIKEQEGLLKEINKHKAEIELLEKEQERLIKRKLISIRQK